MNITGAVHFAIRFSVCYRSLLVQGFAARKLLMMFRMHSKKSLLSLNFSGDGAAQAFVARLTYVILIMKDSIALFHKTLSSIWLLASPSLSLSRYIRQSVYFSYPLAFYIGLFSTSPSVLVKNTGGHASPTMAKYFGQPMRERKSNKELEIAKHFCQQFRVDTGFVVIRIS